MMLTYINHSYSRYFLIPDAFGQGMLLSAGLRLLAYIDVAS